MGLRSGAAVGVSVAAMLVVAGCQQPTPAVTIQGGSRSVRSQATAYVRDGKEVRGADSAKVLKLHPGDLVGIDVDASIASSGWSVHITTPGTKSGTTTTVDSTTLFGQHHFSFNVGASTTQLVVSEVGSGSTPKGLWFFTLQPTLP